jgi:acyl carrier protein
MSDTATIIKEELSTSFSIPFGANGMKDDSNLIETGMLDSYGLVELVTFLEKRFAIKLTDADLMSSELTSVAGMVRVVEQRKAA